MTKSKAKSKKTRNGTPRASDSTRADKQKIIELWEERVRKELPATRSQEHLALLDTLPLFLDQMTDALSEKSVQKQIDREVSQVAELHGESRAEAASYTLAQVLLEYRILREVVFAILESENLLPPEKRDIVFNSFQTAMTGAASEFMRVKVFRLQAAQGQAELYAKSLQDLESVTEVALSRGASCQEMLHELLGRSGIIRAHGGNVEVNGPYDRSDRTSITIHLPKDARSFIQKVA